MNLQEQLPDNLNKKTLETVARFLRTTPEVLLGLHDGSKRIVGGEHRYVPVASPVSLTQAVSQFVYVPAEPPNARPTRTDRYGRRTDQARASETVVTYARVLERFETHCINHGVDVTTDLRPTHLTTFIDVCSSASRAGEFAPGTRRNYQIILTAFCRWCFRKGHTESDITPWTRQVHVHRQPRTLTTGEQRLLVNVSSSGAQPLRTRAIILLLLCAGLRIGELINARVADVSPDCDAITVTGKGGVVRKVPFCDPASTALRMWIEHGLGRQRHGDTPLFAIWRKRNLIPPHRNDVQCLINRMMVRALIARAKEVYRAKGDPCPDAAELKRTATQVRKFRQLSPHALRHTYAVNLIGTGVNIATVAQLLGHKTLSTTTIYTELSLEQLRSIAEKYCSQLEEDLNGVQSGGNGSDNARIPGGRLARDKGEGTFDASAAAVSSDLGRRIRALSVGGAEIARR